MEKFALIKSRVNLNRVNLGIALISDLKVLSIKSILISFCVPQVYSHRKEEREKENLFAQK